MIEKAEIISIEVNQVMIKGFDRHSLTQGIFYSAVIHKMCNDNLNMCNGKMLLVQ